MFYLLCLAGGIVAGFVVAALVVRKYIKRGQRVAKRKREFSKIILLLVMATYFVGLVVAIRIVFIDVSQLAALLAYIGGPTTTAIAFYSWKAKAENLLKIKQENPDIPGSPVDFNNISSQ